MENVWAPKLIWEFCEKGRIWGMTVESIVTTDYFFLLKNVIFLSIQSVIFLLFHIVDFSKAPCCFLSVFLTLKKRSLQDWYLWINREGKLLLSLLLFGWLESSSCGWSRRSNECPQSPLLCDMSSTILPSHESCGRRNSYSPQRERLISLSKWIQKHFLMTLPMTIFFS